MLPEHLQGTKIRRLESFADTTARYQADLRRTAVIGFSCQANVCFNDNLTWLSRHFIS